MNIYTSFILICWIVFVCYWAFSATEAKKSKRLNARWFGFRLLLIIILVIYFETSFSVRFGTFHFSATASPILSAIGALLCGAGIALAIWARYHLGKNWGMPMTRREEPELVTSGPYAYIRHPIYTGVIVAIIGSGFASGAGWLMVCVLYAGYFIVSAFVEEKTLSAEFPQQYKEYKKHTKMLIPFVF